MIITHMTRQNIHWIVFQEMFNKNPTHLLRQLLELIVAEIQKLEFSSNLDPGREGAKLIGAQIKLKQDWEKV